MSDIVEIQSIVEASQQLLWRCLTVTEELQRWWQPQLRLEATLGGRFKAPCTDAAGSGKAISGTIVEFVAPASLQISWREADWVAMTRVHFQLTAVGRRCGLSLRHEGWEQFPQTQRQTLVTAQQAYWETHVAALKAHCEGLRKAS